MPQQCPESHFNRASHLQKTFNGHLSCTTRTVLYSLDAYEKMPDLLSASA